MAISEYREFFTRTVKVTTGTKPDQETNYLTEYVVDGKTKSNRFIKNGAPSADIFLKLFTSLAFKKNPEDRATTSLQGLVRLASDTEATNRDSLSNSQGFIPVTQPHQIPKLVNFVTANSTINGFTVPTAYNSSYILYDLLRAGIQFISNGGNVSVDFKIPAGAAVPAGTLRVNGDRVTIEATIKVVATGATVVKLGFTNGSAAVTYWDILTPLSLVNGDEVRLKVIVKRVTNLFIKISGEATVYRGSPTNQAVKNVFTTATLAVLDLAANAIADLGAIYVNTSTASGVTVNDYTMTIER